MYSEIFLHLKNFKSYNLALLSFRFVFQGAAVCRTCFFNLFEQEIHETIVQNKLFFAGETVAIGASGGKGVFFFILFIFVNTYILGSLQWNSLKRFIVNKITKSLKLLITHLDNTGINFSVNTQFRQHSGLLYIEVIK